MPQPVRQKLCAEVEEDVVIFLIGIRINRWWKAWQWLTVVRAMARMLAELSADPELGLLASRTNFGIRNFTLLQYWRSAAHLQHFARAKHHTHLPAWSEFARRIAPTGDVGIWHETYVVPRDNIETVYQNMPRFGLGLVGALFPAKGDRETAAQRLARRRAAGDAD